MKAIKISRVSFSTMSVLLCAAVISSCGSSNETKKKDEAVVTATVKDPGNLQVIDAAPAATPVNQANPEIIVAVVPAAAPIGDVTNNSSDDSTKGKSENLKNEIKDETKTSTPLFDEAVAIKTGGKLAELNYTSFGDDGIMDLFRTNSTTVSKEQQTQNLTLAKAITGAKLKKIGSDMYLDLAIDEFGILKLYKLKAIVDGNKMKLSSISSTGDLEFQAGFVKCLDESCDTAYAKIKMSGAYTRIIFRTAATNNHFSFQSNVDETKYNLWKTYISNTVQGNNTSAKIVSIKTASFEVLNGKSAVGIQILTQDNESVSLSGSLLAADAGIVVNQLLSRTADLSVNYNLPSSVGKLSNLSAAMNETRLVNNNGKGQIKLKMIFSTGSVWLTLSPVEAKAALKAEQVKSFESTVPKF